MYINDPSHGNRIAGIQSDSIGFAQSLSTAVEQNYGWTSRAGLTISSVALASIEYDEDTGALLSDVKKADALSGTRGNSFLQQATARGVQGAGETGGGDGLAMFGLGAGMAGGLANFQQPAFQQGTGSQANQAQTNQAAGGKESREGGVDEKAFASDAMAALTQAKDMLDAGLINDDDYAALKARILGL